MKSISFKEYLTFDDVLLKPQYSEIPSRSQVDLSVSLKQFKFNLPFIPANMASITGKDMIKAMYKLGALSIMHRFCPFEEQLSLIKELESEFGQDIFNFLSVSVGVKDEDLLNIPKFIDAGIKIITIDVAHLDSYLGLKMVRFVGNKYPEVLLIAGNIATAEAAERAWKAGADVVKCGIGSSGICSTRLVSGNGVSQLGALMEIQEKRLELKKYLGRKLYLISDGGHKISADCVKALCFADMVMLGGMLSGTDQTPSSVIELDGKIYREYNGSSTHKSSRIEGVRALVEPKGCVIKLLGELSEGLQSGCSYQNCRNLAELKENPQFIRITPAGLAETKIHSIKMIR